MPDPNRPSESYARFYDDMLENKKIALLKPPSFALYCALIMYCHRNDTDGVVPTPRAERILTFEEDGFPEALNELQDAALIQVARQSIVVHDYLLHNASHAERIAKRNAASSAARVRWGDANRMSDAKRNANGNANEDATEMPKDKVKEKAVQLQVTEPSLLPETEDDDEITRVFLEWRKAFHRADSTRLDNKRRKVIAKALKDYKWEGVTEAIFGYTYDPWPERKVRNDITLLLRDAEHVEAGRALFHKAQEQAMGWAPGPRGGEMKRVGEIISAPRGIGEPPD